MSELELRHPGWNVGYDIDQSLITLELYRLLSSFGGSKFLAEFRKKIKDGNLDEPGCKSELRAVEIQEVSRLLISLAAISRNMLDSFCSFNDYEKHNKASSVIVGKFYISKADETSPDFSAQGRKPNKLSFREACNKILHADFINFDLSNNETIDHGYLRPFVYLYGQDQKERAWKACLNVVDFASFVFELI